MHAAENLKKSSAIAVF